MKRPLSFLCLLLFLTGCQTGVPTTVVNFTPKTGVLHLESPKQVTSKNFKASIKPDGSAEVSWETLSAENEPSVIQTAGEADAKRIQATSGLVKQIGETAGAIGGEAAKAAAGVP